jgi:prepilin-type N-terminal cleavage/methylation domain-containing protein
MQTSNTPIPAKRSRSAAFSLVEVMVASVIGAVIFSALFYGLSQGDFIIQTDRENLRATQIMVGKLEGIRLCKWGDTNSSSQLFSSNYIPTTFVEYFYPSSVGSSNGVMYGAVYNGTISIQTNVPGGANNFMFYGTNAAEASPPSYSNQMALVTITLTWSDTHYGRVTRFNRSMKAYIAQNGLQNYVLNN